MTLQELVNKLSNLLAQTSGTNKVVVGKKEVTEVIISDNKIIIK